VSAGAPLLSKKLLFVGDTTYAFSLAIVSSLLAIVVAPAWIALLAQHFGVEAEVSPARVATALTKGFLAPLGVGIVVQVLAPEAGRRWAERVLGLGGLVMAAAGVGLAATHWDLILEVPPLGAVTLAVYLAGALLLGHVLGGPKDNDRTVLAITCATRHVAVALLVAASFRGPRTAVLVVCYMLVMLAVSIPYVKWRKRVSSQTPTPAAPAGT
jgi:BASS family bile acid:Na+ symporter